MKKGLTKLLIDKSWYDELQLGKIIHIEKVVGGDINLAFKIVTEKVNYFLKVQPNNDQSFFYHEIEGLNLINTVAKAPEVIKSGSFENNGYLIMKYLDFGTGSQYELGEMVAKMHQKHNGRFGLDHSVRNAKNPKINTWQKNWGDFFVYQRLEVLVKEVKKNRHWNDRRDQAMKAFEKQLLTYYLKNPVEPSLLHGDLWNGNVGFLKDGQPILFDPDVFYGNREMDLAMTLLFDGFSEDFYRGYDAQYPLTAGWNERMYWYQTYYLLAHLNLFGETYGPSFDNSLKRSLDTFN